MNSALARAILTVQRVCTDAGMRLVYGHDARHAGDQEPAVPDAFKLMPGFRVSLSHASGSSSAGLQTHRQGFARSSVWDGNHHAVRGEPSMQMVRVYLRALG